MALAWFDLGTADFADDDPDHPDGFDLPGLRHLAAFLERLEADRPAWQADAACREHDPALWFPTLGQSTEPAKAICSGCLVADECSTYAATHPGPPLQGIWAGTSSRARRRLRTVEGVPDEDT